MKKYGIFEDVNNETYCKFIQYALETCDAFMLVACSYTRSGRLKTKIKSDLKILKPYRIKVRHNPEWPNTLVLNTIYSMNQYQHSINVYKATAELYDFLIKPGGMFKWEFPNNLEDLSFFRNGKCWFAVTAHEEFAFIYSDSKEEILYLRSMGLDLDDGEEIDDSKVFYEEYKIKP